MLEVYGGGISNVRPLPELTERYRLLFGETGENGCEKLPLLSSEFAALAASAAEGKDGIDQLVVLSHSRDYLAQIFPPDNCVKRFSLVKREGKTRVIPLI